MYATAPVCPYARQCWRACNIQQYHRGDKTRRGCRTTRTARAQFRSETLHPAFGLQRMLDSIVPKMHIVQQSRWRAVEPLMSGRQEAG